MKRLLPILCLACVLPLSAQTMHYLTFDIGGGYAAGAGADASIGYALGHKHFLMRVSVEGQYALMRHSLADYSLTQRETDSEQYAYTAYYDYSHVTDRLHTAELRVPLMVGVQAKRFYALAGVKGGIRLYGKGIAEADVTKRADYGMFYDMFADMPNHGYTTTHEVQYAAMPIAPALYAAAEVGLRGTYIGGAVFADYRVVGYTYDIRPMDRVAIGAKLTVWIGWQVSYRKRYPCKCLYGD